MTRRHFTQKVLLTLVALALTMMGGCSEPDTMRVPESTPEPVVASSPNATPVSTQGPTALIEESADMTVTVVYDNNRYDPRLPTSWGFSCLVELDETAILFDTGGDAEVLLHNMSVLGLDPLGIDLVVISHIHGDHTGGLGSMLDTGVRPVVHMPRSFPASFKDQVRSWTDVREVSSPAAIMDGVYSTGELGSGIIEQSLVLDTRQGLVVITGCAHPGIVSMVRSALELYGDQIYLVLGGFHLGGKSPGELEGIIAEVRQLGVKKVAPCHCTGEQAMSMFAQEWGDDFIVNGAGRVIQIGN